jgi:hypothetical protein
MHLKLFHGLPFGSFRKKRTLSIDLSSPHLSAFSIVAMRLRNPAAGA